MSELEVWLRNRGPELQAALARAEQLQATEARYVWCLLFIEQAARAVVEVWDDTSCRSARLAAALLVPLRGVVEKVAVFGESDRDWLEQTFREMRECCLRHEIGELRVPPGTVPAAVMVALNQVICKIVVGRL